MVYETAVVLRVDANEEAQAKFVTSIKDIITKFKGELVSENNWGIKTFAQPTKKKIARGNYFYFMYQGNTEIVNELERQFRINEDVLKFMSVKLGLTKDLEKIKKDHERVPGGSQDDKREMDKEKRMFSKKKSCWFSANKTFPDWKDVSTYSWLVNEFGKITPARISGLKPKYQRMATVAIKRARCMGLLSYISSRTAD
jgi:ribosomal protein S6/ribosomal protein S18